MKKILITIISWYQRTLSPDHGWFRARHPYGFCRFYPTCSEYTKQAIIIHGSRTGPWLGFRRLIRCHPWSSGGIDNVPAQP